MSTSQGLTVRVTLVPMKIIFPTPLQWTPPRQLQPIFIHTIQTQQCGCCAPLFIKITSENDSTFSIMDIDEDTREFEDLFHSLQTLTKTMKGQQPLKKELLDLLDCMEIELS